MPQDIADDDRGKGPDNYDGDIYPDHRFKLNADFFGILAEIVQMSDTLHVVHITFDSQAKRLHPA